MNKETPLESLFIHKYRVPIIVHCHPYWNRHEKCLLCPHCAKILRSCTTIPYTIVRKATLQNGNNRWWFRKDQEKARAYYSSVTVL